MTVIEAVGYLNYKTNSGLCVYLRYGEKGTETYNSVWRTLSSFPTPNSFDKLEIHYKEVKNLINNKDLLEKKVKSLVIEEYLRGCQNDKKKGMVADMIKMTEEYGKISVKVEIQDNLS